MVSAVDPVPRRPEGVPVLDASTVVLLRDGVAGLEVCLMQRNLESGFVGGAHVFPGGAVDPEDGDPRLLERCHGRDDIEASASMQAEAGGLAFWVAAIRESFEEAGVLIAVRADGSPVTFVDPVERDRFAGHRAAVDRGERSLLEVCEEESLRLDVGALHYFARWVTPLGAPRRYDTRFFVVRAPEGQEVLHDDRELISTWWVTPAEALRRQEEGAITMILPTARTLVALARFRTADAVIAHSDALSAVAPVLPTVEESPAGMRIRLPGDPEGDGGLYDAFTGRRV